MMTFLALPTALIRMVVVCGLLGVALTIVLRKHRRAGLLMAVGAVLDLSVAVAVPILEVLGLTYFSSQMPPPAQSAQPPTTQLLVMTGALMLIPMIPPLAQAFNLACFLGSTVMLALRLPDEERDASW